MPEDFRQTLLDAGYTTLHISDIRVDLTAGIFCRTVVLQGTATTRFDYHPASDTVDFAEIAAAYEESPNAD